jgi:hypothetical protein
VRRVRVWQRRRSDLTLTLGRHVPKKWVMWSLLRTGVPRIVEGVLIPTGIFSVLSHTSGFRLAVGVSVIYAYGLALKQMRRQGHASAMVSIACVLVTIRAAGSLIINSGHFYFGLPVVETVAVGVMFLITLSSSTPLIVRMATDLAPGFGARLAEPCYRRLVLQLSVVWMAVHVGIAGTTFWLLTHQSMDVFVWLKIVNGWSWMSMGVVATYLLTKPALAAARLALAEV